MICDIPERESVGLCPIGSQLALALALHQFPVLLYSLEFGTTCQVLRLITCRKTVLLIGVIIRRGFGVCSAGALQTALVF